MRAGTVVVGIVAVSTVGCGAGGSHQVGGRSASPFSLHGTISVQPNFNFLQQRKSHYGGAPCTASNELGSDVSDIAKGTQVVVKDQTGKRVAVGRLGPGKVSLQPGKPTLLARCEFPFVIPGVPGANRFYRISVGSRGAQQYPRMRLDAPIRISLQ